MLGGLAFRNDLQGLRTEADGDAAVVLRDHGFDGLARELDAGLAGMSDVAVNGKGAQVHGRGADEAGDEDVGGVVVQLARGAHLLQVAVLEHGDTVTHRQGLSLVVGDVHGGHPKLALESGDLRTGLDTQLRIQVRQRLVHEEDLRVTHDGAAHGHALTLAAGQCLRLALQVLRQAQSGGSLVDALVDLLLGLAGNLQGKAHVLAHGHVRVERVVLEDHGDVAVTRGDVGDVLVADVDGAVGDVFQAGEHAQRGGLTAAGRSDEH